MTGLISLSIKKKQKKAILQILFYFRILVLKRILNIVAMSFHEIDVCPALPDVGKYISKKKKKRKERNKRDYLQIIF